MTDQAHRGKLPEDERLFSSEAIERLKLAAEEMAWLTGRDYDPATVNELVGAHHSLESRQKLALRRGTCSEPQYRRRAAREVDLEDVARRPLAVDALSVVALAEAALSGGLLLQTIDGTVRDLSALDSGWVASPTTARAIELVFDGLKDARPSLVKLYLEEGVPGVDALRELCAAACKARKLKVEIVAQAKIRVALRKEACAVSSDPEVLDRCASWFNLTARVIERTPGAWIVKLQ